MNLIDAHIHLDGYKNHKLMYKIINDNKQYTLCATNSPYIFEACLDNYAETKYIKFALGINPKLIEVEEFDIDNFRSLFNKTKYIGEIGLDFTGKNKENEKKQVEILDSIFSLRDINDKVISIHSNKAETKILELLKKHNLGKKVIMHWYTGNQKLIKEFISLGCYFSINVNMVKKQNFTNILNIIGKNRILIESDGPNIKINNKIYNPALLKDIYARIQKYCEFDLEKQVYNNFYKLLSI